MTRRQTKAAKAQAAQAQFVLKLGVALLGLFLVSRVLTALGPNLGNILLVVVLGTVGVVAFALHSRQTAVTALFERLEAQLVEHQNGLISAYRLGVHGDHFGNRVDSKWLQQVDIFLKTKVVTDVGQYEAWKATRSGKRAVARVEAFTKERLQALQLEDPQAVVNAAELTPREYERHCADVFRRLGWNVQETPASRDSGADFVAQNGRHRVVVQCKRYADPVGNKAVQEVNAALKLYTGTVACVVAPNGYTSQAKREAFGLNIHLLDHVALGAFARQVQDTADAALAEAGPWGPKDSWQSAQ